MLEAENACIADLDAHNRKLQQQLASVSEARSRLEADHAEQLRELRLESEDVMRHASELEQRLRQSESDSHSRLLGEQQEAAHADEKRKLEAVRASCRSQGPQSE